MDTTLLIEKTKKALKESSAAEEQLTLRVYLADLYRKNKESEKAIELLKELIKEQEGTPVREPASLAALYNNLGLLLAGQDPSDAIEAFREADRLYRENEKAYAERIAGVNYQLSQLYTRLNDDYYTKKYLKEALIYFERLGNGKIHEARARAHQQLAQIYSEKLLLFDARNHFKKALDLYEKMRLENNRELDMRIGGILNNLGVTYRQMESFQNAEKYFLRTLEHYQDIEAQQQGCLPWIGATLTNLSNLYAENNMISKAREYGKKALELYEHLSREHPEQYRHYLATCNHNLGLLFMDEDLKRSETYFKAAISIREDLAEKEPQAFNADLAASLMNLTELYHSQWELTLRNELKEKALALLRLVENKARFLPRDHPAVRNILNDMKYYTERFKNEDLSGLNFLKVSRALMPLKEEVNSTIVPGEKITHQRKIADLLRGHVQQYPGHYRGMESLSDALSELAWYYMLSGEPKKAGPLLKEMRSLKSDLSPEAKCNMGHFYLLTGEEFKAKEFYKQVLPLSNEDKKPMKETLLKDLEVLQEKGIVKTLPEDITGLFVN